MNYIVKTLLVFLALLVGCHKEQRSTEECDRGSSRTLTYDQLATESAVISVNGKVLTKSDLEKRVALRLDLMKIKQPKLSNEILLKNRLRRGGIELFGRESLLSPFADDDGLDSLKSEYLESIAKKVAGVKGYLDLKKRLSEERVATLEEESSRWARMQSAESNIRNNVSKEISDDEMVAAHRIIATRNANAEKKNSEIFAYATNVWQHLISGETFEHLSKRIADAGDDDHITVDDGTVELKASDYREDPIFYKTLTSLPTNIVSAPFEGDNGLVILKVVEILPVDANVRRSEPIYVVQRVFFELAMTYHYDSEDEIRAQLLEKRQADAFEKKCRELYKMADIDYPNGRNLFPAKAGSARDLPKEVMRRIPRPTK